MLAQQPSLCLLDYLGRPLIPCHSANANSAAQISMSKSKGLIQAYQMQDFAFNAAMAIREQLTSNGKLLAPDKDAAATIGTLGRLWSDAQDRIRIHRGKPLPGVLKPEPKRKQGANAPTLSIATDVAAQQQTGSSEAAA